MIKGINIVDVLKNKPETKPEEKVEASATQTQTNPEDFEQKPEPKPVDQVAATTEPVEDDFNYENSSDAMIDMIDTVQKSIFILLAAKKLKKKIPEKLMDEFLLIDMKDLAGEKLTPEEKKKLDKYKAFTHRMDRIMQETPFTEEEREEMNQATTAFAKDSKIQIPPGLWFGAKIASLLSKRVIGLAID